MDYRDPFHSLKKLKINNQMTNILEKMDLDLQCFLYQKKYDNICENTMQNMRMPKVKVITKKKARKFPDLKKNKYYNNKPGVQWDKLAKYIQ